MQYIMQDKNMVKTPVNHTESYLLSSFTAKVTPKQKMF